MHRHVLNGGGPLVAVPRLRRLLPVAVAMSLLSIAAILVYFQSQRDVNVLAQLRTLNPWVLVAALGMHMASHGAWTLRILTLARGLGVDLSLVGAWRLVSAGQFAGAVTPGRVGAEGMRLTLLVRGGSGGPAAGRTVLADRTSDLVFFGTLGTLGAFALPTVFGSEAETLRGLALVAAAGLLTMTALLALGLWRPHIIAAWTQTAWNGLRRVVRKAPSSIALPISGFLDSVREGIVALARESPWRLAMAAGLSLFVWGLEYGVLWTLLRGVGVEMPWMAVLASGVLLTMLAAIPISIGGAGVAEVAAVLLLGPWAGPMAPVVVVLWRASSYYYDVIVGGIVAAWSLPRSTPAQPTLQ